MVQFQTFSKRICRTFRLCQDMRSMHYRFSKFLLPLILLSTTAQARLEGIKISSSDTISSGRGVFDPKATLKGNAVAKGLAQMKRARLAQDYKTCTTEAAGARKVAGELSG